MFSTPADLSPTLPAPAPPARASAAHPDILWGDSRPDLIRMEVLADILEATALRTPKQLALVFGDHTLSYQELDARADQVASHLIEAGVRPGHRVGLWLPRGIDLLTMQAGIAKTGAAWLPFDADTPVERIAVCLEDAGAYGLVTCQDWVPRLAATRAP
ncbi:MAG: AMP-binding protein, partial [Ferruginibacter sp.]|nr:AMP-binding protein [Rhodoferax sp.]